MINAIFRLARENPGVRIEISYDNVEYGRYRMALTEGDHRVEGLIDDLDVRFLNGNTLDNVFRWLKYKLDNSHREVPDVKN